jgi:hypothetical protein
LLVFQWKFINPTKSPSKTMQTNHEEKEMSASISKLKQIGREILSSKLELDGEVVTYDSPDVITSREMEVQARLAKFDELFDSKKIHLEKFIEIANFKEKLRLLEDSHRQLYDQILNWFKEQEELLLQCDDIDSLEKARMQLDLLERIQQERK